jgi:hypothetical protein
MDAPSNLTDQALAVLAAHPGEALTGRQIAKRAGIPQVKIAATMQYLYVMGRVHRSQDGESAPYRYRMPDGTCTDELTAAIQSWPVSRPIIDGEEHL